MGCYGKKRAAKALEQFLKFLIYQFASFCCNVVVDGIVFSSGMFIDPIKDDLGASKASVALVGSLLSGFYLIVGPFVSGKFNFQLTRIKLVNNFFLFFNSLNEPLRLPNCDDDGFGDICVGFCNVLFCDKCFLFALLLRRRWRHWLLLHLHAIGHHRRLLL